MLICLQLPIGTRQVVRQWKRFCVSKRKTSLSRIVRLQNQLLLSVVAKDIQYEFRFLWLKGMSFSPFCRNAVVSVPFFFDCGLSFDSWASNLVSSNLDKKRILASAKPSLVDCHNFGSLSRLISLKTFCRKLQNTIKNKFHVSRKLWIQY